MAEQATVMNPALMQFLIVGALVLASGNIIGIIAFWMKMGGRLQTGENAMSQATLAQAQVKLLEEKFNDYREQAAKEFLTDRRLIEAENRMTKSVDGMRNDVREQMGSVRDEVKGLNARLDKFMQSELERARSKT
jgi:hypothetical protein